jgi:hypothetical protein
VKERRMKVTEANGASVTSKTEEVLKQLKARDIIVERDIYSNQAAVMFQGMVGK